MLISFFFFNLKFDSYCCTLFGRQCNHPGVTHTVFFMPVFDPRLVIEGLTVGMLVLKANFIHIKFLKCHIQSVLQQCVSLNKPCNIQCSNN